MPDRNGGELTIPGEPWHFSAVKGADEAGPASADTQVPARQGEHNDEILAELGFSADEVSSYVSSGALVQPSRGMTFQAK